MVFSDISDLDINPPKHDASSVSSNVSRQSSSSAQALIIDGLLRKKAKSLGIDTNQDDATIAEAVFEKEVTYPCTTEEECLKYYEENKHEFFSIPTIEVSHILISADSESAESKQVAKSLAEKLICDLTEGVVTFAEMANMYSCCPSRDNGGYLGKVSNGQAVAEFEKALLKGELGLQAKPIETRFGFHVVNILDKSFARERSFDCVKGQIAEHLNEKKRCHAIADYVSKLVQAAEAQNITVDTAKTYLQ